MSSSFARIAFTPEVRAQQTQMGSREAYRRLDAGEPESARLGPDERDFIAARDSFRVSITSFCMRKPRSGALRMAQASPTRTRFTTLPS